MSQITGRPESHPATPDVETLTADLDSGGGNPVPADAAGNINVFAAAGISQALFDLNNRNIRTLGDAANNTLQVLLNQSINLPQTTALTSGVYGINDVRVLHTFGTDNVFVGSGAGNFTMTGTINSGFGDQTLVFLTTGSNNTAVGGGSSLNIDTGSNNTSVGTQSLAFNTSGSRNTTVGYQSLTANTTSNDSTAVGYQALLNSTGRENTAVGSFSQTNTTTGIDNVSLGFRSLESITTETDNTAIGSFALQNNTASENVAIGSLALNANTTGTQNTAVGYLALSSNVTSAANTAVGYETLLNATAFNNTAVGSGAGNLVSTGAENTLIGAASGDAITTSSDNTAVGYNSLSAAAGNQNTAIGAYALNANTAADNTAIGYNAMRQATTGAQNTFIGSEVSSGGIVTGSTNCGMGYSTMSFLTSGSSNTGIGFSSLNTLTIGVDNVGLGNETADHITSGSNNTAIGHDAGTNWTGSDSSNIAIRNFGVSGDNNVCRIGTNGTGAGQQNVTQLAGGNITKPFSAMFYAVNTTIDANVTGNSATFYTIICDSERYDRSTSGTGNYDNTTGIFTADITGIYRFSGSVRLNQLDATSTLGIFHLLAGGVIYWLFDGNAGAMRDSSNNLLLNGSVAVPLSSGQTAELQVRITGMAGDTVDVQGSGSSDITFFCGELIG